VPENFSLLDARMSDGRRDSNWWEYYFLRYFVGTVAGGIAIVALTKFPGSIWYSAGLSTLTNFSDLKIREISGLAGLGFAFCYIASAPMLLLHATRAHLGLVPLSFRTGFWVRTAIGICILFPIIAWWFSISWFSYRGLSVLIFLSVVGFQVAQITAAHFDRFDSIGPFYKKLAEARAVGTPSVNEYVESYRHLREHGNAFSILVLEFVLALVLYSSPRFRFAMLAIVLWILPSFYSWLIGSFLEAKLARSPDGIVANRGEG
jgi:hypothetical protein